METIRSLDNSKVKHVKKLLADKSYRAECFQYVAEGARWVSDALSMEIVARFTGAEATESPFPVEFDLFAGVFVKESCLERFAALITLAEQKIGTEKIFAVADTVFDKAADTKHSQGILAVLRSGNADVRTTFGSLCLFLDGIRDPGNLGTIIRTAVAAGFNDIVLDGCADVYNPKVVRSAMSAFLKAHFWHTLYDEYIEKIRQKNYQIYAADMNGENIFTLQEKPEKICLIIGSEADGIRPGLLKLADKIVSVPMKNTESLNAAVAAGILMYGLGNRDRA